MLGSVCREFNSFQEQKWLERDTVRRVSWAAVLLSSGPRVKIYEAGINESGSRSL